jgi:hypothetical protein
MDYAKLAEIRNFYVDKLNDHEIAIFIQALEEEKERREERKKIIEGYKGKLKDFISMLHDNGFILTYDCFEVDIDSFDIDIDIDDE